MNIILVRGSRTPSFKTGNGEKLGKLFIASVFSIKKGFWGGGLESGHFLTFEKKKGNLRDNTTTPTMKEFILHGGAGGEK